MVSFEFVYLQACWDWRDLHLKSELCYLHETLPKSSQLRLPHRRNVKILIRPPLKVSYSISSVSFPSWNASLPHLYMVSGNNRAVVPNLEVMIRYPTYQIFVQQFITLAKLQFWSSKNIILWVEITTMWASVSNSHSIRKMGEPLL